MNPTDTTPQTANSLPQQPSQVFKSPVYWRKSLWNGAKTVPSILSINGTTLSLKSDRETAFEVPVNAATIRYTAFRTLVIKVDGKKYDITGVGAAISRPFTEQQKQELSNDNANTPTNSVTAGLGANAVGVAVGGAGGAAASVAGNVAAIAGFVVGVKELEKWKPIFTKFGLLK